MRDYGLGATVALWISVLVVLEQPPKWWYGDAIEVHALSFWPKVFVSDFVWLGLATLLVIAWECRPQGKYHRYGKSLAGVPSQTGASDKITL